jgi:tetratricopeptide (TPR) repeat protein
MSRRLLTAASCAALLFALAWAAPSSAKPPDLPYMPKDTLTPEAPSNLEIILVPMNPASQERLQSHGLFLEPAYHSCWGRPIQRFVLEAELFPVRASARRSLVKCLLWTANPVLSLAPVDDYLNDLDDESCQDVLLQAQEDVTGSLFIGVGVNSDAGLTGSIVLNENNFDLLTPPAPEPIAVMPKELPEPAACENFDCPGFFKCGCGTGFHIGISITEPSEPATPEPIGVMPKECPCEPPSVCPWMRGEVCPDRHVILMADPDLSRDVIENLEKLHQAETLLESARRFARAGNLCEALKRLGAAAHVCPGCRFDEKVARTAADVFATYFLRAAKADAAAEEQSEPAQEKDGPRSPESLRIRELLNRSEDLRQIEAEWERMWAKDGLPCLTPEKVEAFVTGESKTDKAAELMKQFNAAFKEGRYAEALRCAEQAHELDPDNPVFVAAVQVTRCQQCMQEGHKPCCDKPCLGRCSSKDMVERSERAAERDIEKKLQQPVTLHYSATPLREVIDDLRERQGIDIFVDKCALEAQEVSLEFPVSMRVEDVSLKSALNLVLNSAHLTYVIKDGVLQITTKQAARGKTEGRVYEVADLLDGPACPCDGKEKSAESRAEALIKIISTTVAPESWAAAGGLGTIDFYPCARGLVVNQPADIQEQVADALEALRRLQGQADEKAEKKGADCEEQEPAPCCGPPSCCEKCEQMHQAAEHKRKAEDLLRQCRRLMYAGRQKEAAALARQAYQLDPKTASADPLVYKLQLPAAAPAKPAAKPITLCPCLPPVDPGVVQALDTIIVDEETVRPTLYLVVEQASGTLEAPRAVSKPFRARGPAAAAASAKDADAPRDEDAAGDLLRALTGGHGMIEIGFGLDGSLRLFAQVRGGAVWHAHFDHDGLSVWAAPSGGAAPETPAGPK